MDKYEIGEKLKMIRISRDISQEDVAEFLGSTAQKVSSFETGRTRISLESFVSLCSFYKITPDEFFDIPNKGITPNELNFLNTFRQLNEEGQEKMMLYGKDLIASGRYIKNNESDLVDKKRRLNTPIVTY